MQRHQLERQAHPLVAAGNAEVVNASERKAADRKQDVPFHVRCKRDMATQCR
jgi:hypothetical protein